MNFTELNLDERLQKGINEAGYTICTPVQEKVLSTIFDANSPNGGDLYVQSHTGSGKTAAFLIMIFQQILQNPTLQGKKALVIVPTRELAVQVEEEARLLGKFSGLQCASFYGGVGYEKQHAVLKKGVDIMIGTPGRLIDLQKSRVLDLSCIGFLVVDEADRMFDMGFYPDLRTLINFLPKAQERQTLLFSATLSSYVKNLAWEYTIDAKEITIETENIVVNEIEQVLFHVSSDDKMKLLLGLLKKDDPVSVIIFCNTKKVCEIISKRLEINGIKSEFIVGDLPQKKRLHLISLLKKGSIKCLVATDVASRGIDINDLALVINYDLPEEAENYVHRIGRTARAGKTGKAYSFCSEKDVYNLPAIEKYTEVKIPAEIADDLLYIEDKSKNMYIKLERDEQGDRGDRDRQNHRGNANKTRAKQPNTSYNREGKDFKGTERKKDFSKKERFADSSHLKSATKKSNTRQSHNKASDLDASLSHLSFDDRMKIYKEKYASLNKSTHSRKPQKNTHTKKNDHNKPAEQAKKMQETVSQPKKGLFSKIASLFKK
ncbi:MAG: DEAD/DEAH box helicase [Treponemataceae bacterium]